LKALAISREKNTVLEVRQPQEISVMLVIPSLRE
jgi:hypothetical protein